MGSAAMRSRMQGGSERTHTVTRWLLDWESMPFAAPNTAAAPPREAILSQLRARIVAFAASRGGRDVAEDLAQEVLVLLHTKYAAVEHLEELVPLALQIARFKLAGFWRTANRRGEGSAADVTELPLPGDAPDPHVQAERQELLGRLLVGIRGMPERCRDLFRLKLQGRTFPEIQAVLGAATLNTVYTWDHRCRKTLLERIGTDGRWTP